MGERQETAPASGLDRMRAVLITGAVLSLPVFLPGALGGLNSLIPIPVFYYLLLAGQRQGALIAAGGLLLTAAVALALGAVSDVTIPLALAPLGFVLARAARKNASPLRAGAAGVLFLGGLLLVLGLLQAVFGQGNPYAALVASLEHGLATARDFYRESAELPPETLKEIEAILTGLGEVLPRVLPGLLAMTVLATVWINLVAGNWLLRKKTDRAPWAPYRQWRLPEALVWGVILAGIAILAPSPRLNVFGLNLLLGLGLLYFFQGLAVLVCLLGRWSVPRPLRWAIYILLLIQFYGILVVAILGLFDIWADFRNRTPKPNHPE
jgi:uncharacterized protein YybS (DUF2232 family)